MRLLTEKDVEFSIECEPEYMPIRGNFSSGNDIEDKKLEDEISQDLVNGNQWAWCCVEVRASWKSYQGIASLGACSYESEDDFIKQDGYYDDMKQTALDDLNKNIQAAWLELKELDE